MFKKIIVLVLMAQLGFNTSAYALTCIENNRVSMDPTTQWCCCEKISETATEETLRCEPANPVKGIDANGKEIDKCPDKNGKTRSRISTKANDTCICEFTKPKPKK